MDYTSYTEETFENFVRLNVCQGDKLLEEYLKRGDVSKFRTRLSKFPDSDKRIQKVVISLFTESLKDIILSKISSLTQKMKPLGFLIISGGAAINKYLPKSKRDVLTDIDTKFVPSVKGVSSKSPKYFGYIQMAKLLMWYYLGAMAESLSNSKQFRNKIDTIRNTKIGKILGINWTNPMITRRYSLISKFKGSRGLNVSSGDILIDVEIMALDIQGVRYYVPSKKRILTNSVGGILDIAYMRKGEIGGKVLASTTKGLGKHKNVLVSGRDFLIEDIYILKSLRLRPEKIRKDRERLEKFARHVYNINVKATNSNFSIYKRASKKKMDTRRIQDRGGLTPALITKISKLNPLKFKKYTTKPTRARLARIMSKSRNLSSSSYKFNVKTKRWVKVPEKSTYIRNMGGNKLYGYVESRDKWIPRSILKSSSIIPRIGI